MNRTFAMLADFDSLVDTVSVEKNLLTSGFSQTMLILGALALMVVIIFFGVIIFRKQLVRRKRHHHHRRKMDVSAAEQKRRATAASRLKQRQKKRRRKRSRNPTLAETRGLPPHRQEQPSSSTQS